MDIYTKAVLTIIAIALTAIAIENSGILPAHAAQQGVMSVQICGVGSNPAPLSLPTGKDWDCAHVVYGRLATYN